MKHLILIAFIFFTSCENKRKTILERIPQSEYERLMNSDYQDFDQSPEGWRKYYDDIELQILLVSDYMEMNNVQDIIFKWHLGQLYSMNNEYDKALQYFYQCTYSGSELSEYKEAWNYYVLGTVGFIEKDEKKLDIYLDSLRNNEENMNIEVLLRLKENFSKDYKDAY